MSDLQSIKKIAAVSELPPGWTRSALEEISTVIMGQSPSSRYYNSDGRGLPFFQGKAEFGALYPKPVKWCTEPTKVAKMDDVLISVRAPVGPTNLAPSECCIGRGLAAIRPNMGVLGKYIFYYLRGIQSEIEALGTGTTFKAISGGILRSLPILIAPINEQERIVSEIEKQFSRLDEAVASLRHAKANLKRYKASLLKAAVEGRLTEQWRKEHSDVEPAEKLLEHILTERRKKWDQAELSRLRAKGKETKDGKLNGEYQEPQPPDVENLPDIPASWIWARLDALTDIKGGITKDSKRKIRNARSLPYLRVANVQRGYLELTEMKNIEVPVDQVNELLLEVGDILFNEGGDRDKLGRGWIWEGKIRECTYQNHVFRARPYLKGLQGRFISWFGNTSGKQFFVAKGKQTTNLASVNKTMLSSFPIPLPPLSEQAAIVMEVERRLTISNEMEREMEINLRKAERLRQSVLKRAFSGRLFARNLNHKGIDTPVVTVNRGDHHLGLKIHNR